MTWLFVLSGAVAAGLLAYLVAALLNPEDFS
ncbi:MAG: K(+)-transporting ATPase subunit F [Azonexus sp.]